MLSYRFSILIGGSFIGKECFFSWLAFSGSLTSTASRIETLDHHGGDVDSLASHQNDPGYVVENEVVPHFGPDLLEDRLQQVLPRLKEVRMLARRNPDAAEELEALRADVAAVSSRLEGYLDELRQIGCVFKGPQGLVDFYSMREGRPVFLCWHHGEEEVRYWHELDGGFAGRQALEPAAAAPS